MTIIGIAGAIGSGKSFTQLKHGLKYVEERQKQLVTNFPINIVELRKYAMMPIEHTSIYRRLVFEFKNLIYIFRYILYVYKLIIFKKAKKPRKPRTSPHLPWIKWLCENGGIIQIPAPEKIEALLIPESVTLLDEAGILLNSREFANTSKQLLADLAQSRKDGCDLIWCAQFDEQVDRQLRMLTQFWIHCESLSVFDKKMRRPKLFYKRIFWFRSSDYQEWLKNSRARGNHLKTRLIYATIYEGGMLDSFDKQLFKIYDSFKRLDKKYGGALINTFYQCKLSKDYYFQRLSDYSSVNDPFSKDYQPLWGWYLSINKKQKQNNNIKLTISKTELVSSALSISRLKNIKAPYFKNMSVEQIQNFIKTNK